MSDGYGRGTTYQLNLGLDGETLKETLKADGETLKETLKETLHADGETLQKTLHAGGETLQETLHADGETLQETLHADGETLQETLHAGGETLQGLETGVTSKRMTRDEMIKKILAFCSEWRTAEEIAVYLHRNKRYITNEILPEMDNLLEWRYPQIRRHPDQKYRSKAINKTTE